MCLQRISVIDSLVPFGLPCTWTCLAAMQYVDFVAIAFHIATGLL